MGNMTFVLISSWTLIIPLNMQFMLISSRLCMNIYEQILWHCTGDGQHGHSSDVNVHVYGCFYKMSKII